MNQSNQKLRYPVNYIGITNGYSSEHQAIDLGWHEKQDEPIYACADGVVDSIWEDTKFGGGLTLTIKYNNGYSSDFKHLSKILVNEGQTVSQGQEVAIMGNSGWASAGTHLHYNCYKNGARVNPLEHTYLYPEQEVCDSDKDKVMIYHEEQTAKFNIGDKVIINGDLYLTANSKKPNGYETNKITFITRIAEDTKHPYNTTGDLGWMNESDIQLYEDKNTYVVKKGDTLSSIAAQYNMSWQKLYAKNKFVIGNDPNKIKPGQVLHI